MSKLDGTDYYKGNDRNELTSTVLDLKNKEPNRIN